MPLTQDLGRFASGLTFENLPQRGGRDCPHRLYRYDRDNDRRRQRSRAAALAPGSRAGAGAGQPVFLRRERRRSGSGLDQRHRGSRARLRRCRLPRPRLDRAGAGDPGRGRNAWGSAGARCSRPMSRATRPGPSWRAAIPATTTSRAGTRPAFSARSERAPPAPHCAGSIPTQATMAIALSASQAGGIMANFGTMTKPFHAGRAAHAGLVSARLAELGFTAAARRARTPAGLSVGGVARGACRPRKPDPCPAGNGRLFGRVSASRNTPPATAPTGRSTRCSTCSRCGL